MDDEAFYSEVTQELDRQGPVAGLWAKAFAESDGEDSKAKALYLRLRVAQLKAVYEKAEADAHEVQRYTQEANRVAEQAEHERIKQLHVEAQKRLPVFQRELSPEAVVIAVLFAIFIGVSIGFELYSRR